MVGKVFRFGREFSLERLRVKSLQNRLVIVLIGVQSAGNAGSVARAMRNMDLRELRLVSPECDPHGPEAERMARDGRSILQAARRVSSLDEALADCHYAVATTGRKGKRRGEYRSPRQLAPEIIERAARERVALVFGPEDRGLSAEHLSRCQTVLAIPTSREFKSLNLAQAVMIVAYELFVAALDKVSAPAPAARPTLGEQEATFGDLQSVLLEIGYLDPNNPEHIMLDLRRLLGRAELTERDLRILRGIVRQIRWASGKNNG